MSEEFKLNLEVIHYKNKKYISLNDLLLGLYGATDSGNGYIETKDLISALKELKPVGDEK
jgi:hypothetical protein